MSVFISWAEKESLSHAGALLLQKWLPEVLHNLDSFVSSEDIASGTLWLQKLFDQLEKSESGILCLTKESLDRNWILFEAGALAKRAGSETGRVCPLLFEFKTLNFPLAAFQAHSLDKDDNARSKKEMFHLVKTLNQNRPAAALMKPNWKDSSIAVGVNFGIHTYNFVRIMPGKRHRMQQLKSATKIFLLKCVGQFVRSQTS